MVGTNTEAYFWNETSGEHFRLKPGEDRSGMVLLELDLEKGWARLRRGDQERNLLIFHGSFSGSIPFGLPSPVQPQQVQRLVSAKAGFGSQNSDAVGETARPAQSVPANFLREVHQYIRSLPQEEKEPARQLMKAYAAEPINSGLLQEEELPAPRSADVSNSARPIDASERRSIDAILSAPVPEPGSLSGTVEELRGFRSLYRNETDLDVKKRIQQQINGYAAPAIAQDS